MKIKDFKSFNEELNIKKGIAAGLLSASLLGGCTNGPKDVHCDDVTEINNKKFYEYEVDRDILENDLTFTIGPSGFIGTRWHVSSGKSGHNEGTITIDKDVDVVYYDDSAFMNIIYADSTSLNSNSIDLKKLKIVEETDTYKIYDAGYFKDAAYIMVNNGYQNKENEFTIDGVKYTYLITNLLLTDRYFVVRVK